MKVLIVEDETTAQEILIEYLNPEPDIKIVGFAETINEFLKKTKELKPDLVLLDIRLRGEDSLNQLQILSQAMDNPPFVIITTAYSEADYRQRAQDGYSLAYLTKPITQEKLSDSLNFIRKKIKNRESKNEYLKQLIQNKIQLKTQVGEFLYVKPEEITFCTSSGNYTEIYFHNQASFTLISKNLSWIESRLPKELFVRISRFNIININRIRGFSQNSKKVIFDSIENNTLAISELTTKKLKIILEKRYGYNFM